MQGIRFILNGKPAFASDFEPHTTVLAWLRREGLTGTKEGCAEGECGACAVALVARDPEGRTRYEAVNSCLLLLGQVADRELVTVEGIANGKLHPVQQSMVDLGGSQCGYCTPGFVVSLFSEFYRPGRTGFDPESISGNLCRCTGYRPIRDAARGMSLPMAGDAHRARLDAPPPTLEPLRYEHGKQRIFRPTNLTGLWDALAAAPQALLITGGTDLVVEMNQRHRRVDAVIALDGVRELHGVEWTGRHVDIGAAVTLREIEELLHGKVPLFDELLPLFSSRLIRSRATLGGNLANASPIGDSPPVLLALDAEVVACSASGSRVLPLDGFFAGYRKTVLAPGEIIHRVRIPLPMPQKSRFFKVSKRILDDISTVAAAFALDMDAQGTVTKARLAYGGVAATPVRARAAEAALVGQRFTAETAARVAAAATAEFQPMGDHRGSADYRRAMIGALVSKFHAELEAP